MNAWNIKQLHYCHQADVLECACDAEIRNCESVTRMEMRKLAESIKENRRFTPCEEAILDLWGVRI